MVPQIAILALIGGGLYAGYRWLYAAQEITADVRRSEDELRRRAVVKDMGALEYDPASGVYRPKRH
jgi:hypothetical protein